MNRPILYSFRRCPYAMRARLGLLYANVSCELREVVLREKPPEMLALSEKATVPVLHLPNGHIIDESYDIIKWATSQNDPDHWQEFIPKTDLLITENDGNFKMALDKYKYASRFPEHPPYIYREEGEVFLHKLDQILQNSSFLLSEKQTIADIALFPFIRQFAHVDKEWFFNSPYLHLRRWLQHHINSASFRNVMKKYPKWQIGNNTVYFPDLDQGSY